MSTTKNDFRPPASFHLFSLLWGRGDQTPLPPPSTWVWGKPDGPFQKLMKSIRFLIYVGGETIRPPNENRMFLEATEAVLEAKGLFWKPKPQGLFWKPQKLFWSPQGLFWSPLELF